MSLLKSCIEASNAVKKATDETVNFCFTQIVNDVFDGKRNLLRLLLRPQSNLKRQQTDQIKQIFHTKFQKLIEIESDKVAMDIGQESPIPTLANIAETIQTVITSFLDFYSIKQLTKVCSSIAPVCITQLVHKMDIKVLNVHELIMRDHGDKVKIQDIIQSAFKTHRIRRTRTLKSFVQDEITIPFGNLLCFQYLCRYSWQVRILHYSISGTNAISDLNVNGSAFLFMDKVVVESHLHRSLVFVDHHESMVFVQEFDIKLQSLRITDVVPTVYELTFDEIKRMITNRIHQDVTLYVINKAGKVRKVITGIRPRDQYIAAGIYTIVYERNIHHNMSESAKEELKVSNYKKLKPFYASIRDAYKMSTSIPGTKYNDLALDLENNYPNLVPYEDIAKCFKKAYDLSPNHPPFIMNYIQSLVNASGEEEDIQTARQLFQQKLKLHDDGMLHIPHAILQRLYVLVASTYELRGESQDKIALHYYHKAVQIIKSEIDRRNYDQDLDLDPFHRPFCDPDHFVTTNNLRRDLCETYYNIARVYEAGIEYEQDKTAPKACAQKYHLKTLEMQPFSAFHQERYAKYLKNYQRNYSEAIVRYIKVEKLIESNDWMDRSVPLFDCYGGWFDCLVVLERYKEAEMLCLRWIQSAQDSDKKGCHLKHAYDTIIRLYRDYLKQPEAANLYSSMRSKLLLRSPL
eukprot:57081_1